MSETSTDAVELGTTTSSESNLQTLAADNDPNTVETDDGNSVEPAKFDLAEPFDLRFKAHGRHGKIPVRHVLRQPTLRDLIERDAAQPYRSQMVNDDVERPVADIGNTADEKLYNKLVTHTEGYKFNVTEGQSPEERAAALSTKNIPKQHKKNVISQIVQFDAKYVIEPISDGADEDTEVFQWGENLTYKFTVEFGPNGLYKVTVVMNEPSTEQLDQYHQATNFEIERGTRNPITRMNVDLKPVVIVFDELLNNADGFLVAGVPFDSKNPLHIKLVNGYFKRAVMTALVKQTQLDMGN